MVQELWEKNIVHEEDARRKKKAGLLLPVLLQLQGDAEMGDRQDQAVEPGRDKIGASAIL